MGRKRVPPSERTARAMAAALNGAEANLERPNDVPASVKLKPGDISLIPELFQPREFSFGMHEVDQKHVQELSKRIERKGELDPILVLRTHNQWFCVDGHHRLAAYKRARWTQPINCEWFSGTVRDAIDESLRRNEVAKLKIATSDRFEAAWKRTVLQWGSKSEVVRLTGVSEGIVAMMRRVKRVYEANDAVSKKLQKAVGPQLDRVKWRRIRAAYLGLEDSDTSIDDKAAILAKRISQRLTNLLSKSPAVTARALAIYDANLPEALIREFNAMGLNPAEETYVVDPM